MAHPRDVPSCWLIGLPPILLTSTGVKTQNPAEQSRVRAQDRLRLVSMPAEKPAPAQAEAPSQEGNA